ncbi:MAG TPA: hypothetical protein VI704_07125 [Bacteroidota bacterium]|nr:hypothetical protein [Bacteroidota bacterium]
MTKKKKPEPEYRLNIFYYYDKQTKEKKLVFLVRTIQEFVNFNYEILLNDKVEDHTIHIKIGGLNTPSSLMPGTGPARGKKEYAMLKGTYLLVVSRLDGARNDFRLEITPHSVRILDIPKNPLVLVSAEPVMLL